MKRTSEIEQLIQGSLVRAREKVASSQARQEPTSAPAPSFDASVDKLASAFERLAGDPRALSKISEVGPNTGTDSPAVQPPTDESRSTIETQPKDTVGPSPHTAQSGSETEPGTDEGRDTHSDNAPQIATVTETPAGIPDKVAAAENESATSPQEYAAGEGTPISTRIPFLADHGAVQAFKKRQAVQVSKVGVLSGLFNEAPFTDPVLHRNFDNAEAAGVKTRGS